MIEAEHGVCRTFKADVTRVDDCQAMADYCIKTWGRIDILHNNVGIVGNMTAHPGQSLILATTDEEWDMVMNVNLKGIFHTCRAVLPQMLKQGSGCIVNTSSTAAMVTMMFSTYMLSKAGVNTFTRQLAGELASKGIRVNCIMPGLMDTPTVYQTQLDMFGGDIEKLRKFRNENSPTKHMGEPWDIAYAALYLASDEAKYISGQILSVNGGPT